MFGWLLGGLWLIGRRNKGGRKGAKEGALVQAITAHELSTGNRLSRREVAKLKRRAKRMKL